MNKKRNNEAHKTSDKHSNGQSKNKNIGKKKGFFNKNDKDKRDRKQDDRRDRRQDDKRDRRQGEGNAKFKQHGNAKKPKYKDSKYSKDSRGERGSEHKGGSKYNKDSRGEYNAEYKGGSKYNKDNREERNSEYKGGSKDYRKSSNAKQPFQKKQSNRGQSAPNYNLQKPGSKPNKGRDNKDRGRNTQQNVPEKMRLNRFISNSGVCSRREADKLIEMGMISVNGKVITEMGFQVMPTDVIKYGKRVLKREKFVYVLLNKPKDFITTTNDPQDRKTVMDLVKKSCDERIYPVGRLDRNTTGLLLFTNDGEVAKKLSHPSHDVKKVYQVDLDKPLTEADLNAIAEGVILEDGYAAVDEIAILNQERTSIGVEIHIGRNRIVRRIFNHLGYDVVKLDRTMYAGLNKKNIDRGDWRYLSEKEVIRLKYFA